MYSLVKQRSNFISNQYWGKRKNPPSPLADTRHYASITSMKSSLISSLTPRSTCRGCVTAYASWWQKDWKRFDYFCRPQILPPEETLEDSQGWEDLRQTSSWHIRNGHQKRVSPTEGQKERYVDIIITAEQTLLHFCRENHTYHGPLPIPKG